MAATMCQTPGMTNTTTKTYTVAKAYKESGPDGWDLFEDGEWANRFPLKRDAMAAKAELEESV